jgi:cytoskeletal protein RodZ
MMAFLAKPLIKWGIVAAIIGALSVALWIAILNVRHEKDQNALILKDLAQVVSINEANQDTIKNLKRTTELANEATKKAVAKAQRTVEASEKAIKESMNEEGANAVVNLYRDNLADRLRVLDAQSRGADEGGAGSSSRESPPL